MLPASDLAWMRAEQERLLPSDVVIERYTLTPDGIGGFTEAWPAVGTVTGRIYPVQRRGQTEFMAGAQRISETTWYATFPVGTDVQAKDRLVKGTRSWEVTKVNNDEDFQTAVRCELMAHNEERRI